ncbi:hypothetical protein [Haloferax gibbonsii]|uniref:hypothetical protein n=1 Tax=Haloferax gibbonsii TaxID=35746 RepID=UPI0012692AEF|nr:hypothetical protein [Haloferax gibbonsii]
MSESSIVARKCSYHPEEVQVTDRDEHRIYLPEEIANIDLEEGDCVRLDKLTDSYGNKEVTYLRGEFDSGSRCDDDYRTYGPDVDFKKIITQGSSRCRITVAKKWVGDIIGGDTDQIFVVEINSVEDKPHFRIYNNYDFNEYRHEEIKKAEHILELGKPVIVPILAVNGIQEASDTEWVDVAESTPYDGQKFEIIPVEPDWPPVVEEVGSPDDRIITVLSTHFTRAAEGREVPAKEANRIAVAWNPDDSEHSRPFYDSLEEVDSLAENAVYTDYLTSSTKVILPKKGSFTVYGYDSEGIGRTWISFTEGEPGDDVSIGGRQATDDWRGMFVKQGEDCIQVYVPVPGAVKRDGQTIKWHF